MFGDADCRTAFCVTGNEFIARGVLGDAEDRYAHVRAIPTATFVAALGLTHLPALVHLRQDTTLLAAAEGWDPRRVAAGGREIGKELEWSHPELATPGDPLPPRAGPSDRCRAGPRTRPHTL